MRAQIISLACLMALTTWSQARLGETLDECVDRYGPIIEKRPAEFPQSDPEIAVFSKASISIFIEFKGGKAWKITFRKPVLTSTEVESLLKANQGERDWSPPLTVVGRIFRQSDDHERVCVVNEIRAGMPTTVEFLSRDYMDQFHANLLAAVRNPNAAAELKNKTNPLPGF